MLYRTVNLLYFVLIDKIDRALGDYYKRLKHTYYDEDEEDGGMLLKEKEKKKLYIILYRTYTNYILSQANSKRFAKKMV